MTEILGLQVLLTPPKEFIRGQSLEFLMDLPPTVPEGFFAADTVETTLAARLCRAEDASDDGFIADLIVTWEDSPSCTQLRFKSPLDDDGNDVTAKWPLGLVEFDVFFTKTTIVDEVTTVKTFRSLPVRFKIVDGITRAPVAESEEQPS